MGGKDPIHLQLSIRINNAHVIVSIQVSLCNTGIINFTPVLFINWQFAHQLDQLDRLIAHQLHFGRLHFISTCIWHKYEYTTANFSHVKKN